MGGVGSRRAEIGAAWRIIRSDVNAGRKVRQMRSARSNYFACAGKRRWVCLGWTVRDENGGLVASGTGEPPSRRRLPARCQRSLPVWAETRAYQRGSGEVGKRSALTELERGPGNAGETHRYE